MFKLGLIPHAALGAGLFLLCASSLPAQTAFPNSGLLSDPVDISSDFHEFSNTYFLADRAGGVRPRERRGHVGCGSAINLCRASLSTTWNRPCGPFGGVTFPEGNTPSIRRCLSRSSLSRREPCAFA